MSPLRDGDQVGVMQHYRYADGSRRLRMRRPRAHTLSDELVPPRRPVEPVKGGWREFFEVIAGILVLGSLYIGFLAWIAIASASTVTP